MSRCKTAISGELIKEISDRVTKVTDTWYKHPVIEALTGGNPRDWARFYEQTLPGKDWHLSNAPNLKEVRLLEKATKKYLAELTKTPSKIGRLFKLPENILMKNPVTERYFNQLVEASNFYRGDMHTITSDMKKIANLLNSASYQKGYIFKNGVGKNRAQQEIAKKEAIYNKLKAEGNYNKADQFYAAELRDLHANGELSALQAMYDMMLDPRLVFKQNIKNSKLKYGGEIVEAAMIWHNDRPGTTGTSLKHRLWKSLGNGLLDNISILKKQETPYSKETFQIEKLEQLYNDYFSKNAPKKVKNYFPRQVLDIMPTFAKLSQDIWSGKSQTKEQGVKEYIDNMIKNVTNNLERPGSLFERLDDAPSRTSKDVLGVLDHYSKSVLRFNYNARVSKITTEALSKLSTLEGKGFDNHLKFLTEYIESTHNAALGITNGNSKLHEIARTITAWQFISKLGLNIRSAARNATQSLQNWVYFGNEGIREAFSDMKSDRMKKIVTEEMSKQGFEFVNIQEFAVPKDLLHNVKIQDGRVVEIAPNQLSRINSWFEKVAKVTGKPMEWVENHINRGVTFKIGFLQEYRNLMRNDAFLKSEILRNWKNTKQYKRDKVNFEDLSTEKQTAAIEKHAIKIAARKAAGYVKSLHYLYDPFGKPQVLQNPIGAVLGQFSTYSINFFEYQRKIAAKGGQSLLAGEWNSLAAWRLYRLGMLYTAVTGLSAVTNTKWGNLIENDSWERLKQLDQYYRGDAEAKKQAFYGKRPATAIFGGPFVSDVMKYGQLINFLRMNHTQWTDYANGYEAFSKKVGRPELVEEFVRTLNPSIHRMTYKHFESMINGASFPTVIGQELGLYQTNDFIGLKNKMLYPFQNYLPKKMANSFKPDKPVKEPVKYSEAELQLIFKALQQAQMNR